MQDHHASCDLTKIVEASLEADITSSGNPKPAEMGIVRIPLNLHNPSYDFNLQYFKLLSNQKWSHPLMSSQSMNKKIQKSGANATKVSSSAISHNHFHSPSFAPKDRHNPVCVVNIIEIKSVTLSQFPEMSELLLRKSPSFLKKSTHFFYFIVNPELFYSFPYENMLIQQTKNKVIMIIDPDGHISLKFLCYYCNPTQQQQEPVIVLNMRSTNDDTSSPESLSYSHFNQIRDNFLLPKLSRRRNFQRKVFRVSCPINVPQRLLLKKLPNGKFIALPGMLEKMFKHLSLKLNMTIDIITSSNGGTGTLLPNGSWVGVVGDVVNGRAHFGALTAAVYERFRMLAFTHCIEYQSFVFIYGKHEHVLLWKSLIVPFQMSLWICLALSFVVGNVFLILMITSLNKNESVNHKPENQLLTSMWTPGKIVEYTYGAFVGNPSQDPVVTPVRIFLIFWVFFALLISTAYQSKLASALAVPPLDEPPLTYQGLINSTYKWGMLKVGDAIYNLWKFSKNPTYQQLFKGMELYHDPFRCVKEAVNRKFCCFIWSSALDLISARNMTNTGTTVNTLRESPRSYSEFFQGLSFPMLKDNPLEEDFDGIVHQVVSQDLPAKWLTFFYGIVRKVKLGWMRSLPEKDRRIVMERSRLETDDGPKKFNLQQISGGFFVLAAGLVVAFVVFGWEIIRYDLSVKTRKF
ncbi:unnamed protein product [Orchesella dallaii]|uniref:Ionotropic glutamate receptor C-terminal domain-containing protein n=1 Tax=Orchesella dallaii TaxID=48710 RepID=A0ABP1S2H7_9HEXA